MLPLSTHLHEFEGEPLVTLTWRDRPCWVARHIGSRIGYDHGDKRLSDEILGAWADVFIDDHDHALLENEELAAFHAATQATGGPAWQFGRGPLLVLFEPGVHLIVARTDLPRGRKLRRFLVEVVLPQVTRTARSDGRTVGQPEIDRVLDLFPEMKPRVPASRERRDGLAEPSRTHARWVDLCDRRLKVASLHRLADRIGEVLDPAARAALELIAAETATGLDLANALLPDPDDDPHHLDEVPAA